MERRGLAKFVKVEGVIEFLAIFTLIASVVAAGFVIKW